jgi:hypothetical protein
VVSEVESQKREQRGSGSNTGGVLWQLLGAWMEEGDGRGVDCHTHMQAPDILDKQRCEPWLCSTCPLRLHAPSMGYTHSMRPSPLLPPPPLPRPHALPQITLQNHSPLPCPFSPSSHTYPTPTRAPPLTCQVCGVPRW